MGGGQPAIRYDAREDAGAGVPPVTSVSTLADRIHGRSFCIVAGRCRAILRDILHARQRSAVDRRRFRSKRSETASDRVFRANSKGVGKAAAPSNESAIGIWAEAARSGV